MNPKRILLAALLCLGSTVSAFAQALPKLSRPEDSGFSSDRLSSITTFFQDAIDKKSIPGVVVVVVRDGKCVYLQALGFQDREKNTPMKPDAIFRIASMTKPVTSASVMMLVEQGKIDVLAPVSLYLPEFTDVKVGVTQNAPSNQPTLSLEPPQQPMTVQDLLRHTSGLVYGPFGKTLVHQAYNKANLFDHNQNLTEFATKLSRLPSRPSTWFRLGVWDVHRCVESHR
jgi:CubicO group peptidase (beta-lactamase class C family)